jgi:hypothetical protein
MSEVAVDWAPDLEEVRRAAEGRPVQPLACRFYIDAQEDEAESKRTGKRIFRDVEMMEIRIDSRDIRNRQVTQEDRLAYANQYLAWKAGQDQEAAEGYPLKQWPPIRKGEAETLYMNGIRTVEQLALAADARIQVLGPFTSLRQKAKDWLEEEKRGAGVTKLRNENEALAIRVSTLEAMLKTQSAEIEAARNAGGVLTTAAPAYDPRIAALEARLNALTAAPVITEDAPKRKGGRPKGSKNKPKNGVPEEAPKE